VSNNVEWDGSPRWTRYVDRCIPRVMFDVVVEAPDGGFNVHDFVQFVPAPPGGFPPPSAHDEALLTLDGCQLLDRRRGCTSGLQSGRVAFYMYGYDPRSPLHGTYGEVECPPVTLVPAGLWRLIPDLTLTRGVAQHQDWPSSANTGAVKPALVV